MTLLAGEHGFFFGVPGVAKSLLVADLARYFPGSNYFYCLMGKYTTPEDLFGPVSITALRQDRHEYQTNGYLPKADFAFLDEGFKANSAILNAMLMLMNERLFRNGTEMQHVPLRSMFLASNELPTDPELGAMWDRILFRFHVEDLERSEDFLTLLEREQEIQEFFEDPPVATFTEEEVVQLQEEVRSVEVCTTVKSAIVDIREQLKVKHSIEASSRRWLKALKGVRAHAYKAGRSTAQLQDLNPLVYMLWQNAEQIPDVRRIVWDISNPAQFVIDNLKAEITTLLTQMKTALLGSSDANSDSIMAEYTSRIRDVQQMIRSGRAGLTDEDTVRFGDKLNYMTDVMSTASVMLMTTIGGVDASAVMINPTEWSPENV